MAFTFHFQPPEERHYLEWKYLEFRHFAVIVGFATALIAPALWIWDWVIDGMHAYDALGYRLLMGGILLTYPIAILKGGSRRFLAWLLVAIALVTETLFLVLLMHLQGGLVYGIAGFMYWFMLPIFLGFPLSCISNMIGSILVALLPNLLVLMGVAPEFELAKFNVLIWPTCVIMVFASLSLDQLFRSLFLSKIEIERSLERERATMREREQAMRQVKQLSGLIPLCAHCKKVRDDTGYWNRVEDYISTHSEADFSHGICPECTRLLYPDFKSDPRDEAKTEPD